MHAQGSNLGNTCRQIPRHSSSFAPILPQERGFHLSQQYVGFSTEWRKHPIISHFRNLIRDKITTIFGSGIHNEQVQQMATILEDWLFNDAASQEEYMNQETLMQRLQTQIEKLFGTRYNQQQLDSSIISNSTAVPSSGLLHSWSNQCLAEPTFQNWGGPISPELVVPPDEWISITTCTDNFPVSGGARNLDTSSKPTNSRSVQQHVPALEMDLIQYRNYLGTSQRNESTAFLTTTGRSHHSEHLNSLTSQHVTREVSEVSNLFPSMSSNFDYSSLGDLRQDQLQKLDSEQNFKQFMQPYGHCGNASLAQSSSCFVDQGQHPCQMLGRKTLQQPQLPTRLLNVEKRFTSESLVGRFCLGASPIVNSGNVSGLEASVEQRILLAYFHYKNLNNVSGNNQISFPKYLHSAVCGNGMCTCDRSFKILLHLNNCQRDDCQICCYWKLLCFTGGTPESHLKFTNDKINYSIQNNIDGPSCVFEAMIPRTKRLKVEPAFGVSLIDNVISDPWAQKMVQPYSLKALSEMQEQAESPLSSVYSEVTDCSVEQFTNPMIDSVSISEIKNSATNDTFGQTFKGENILSGGFEADHISEKSKPKDHNVTLSNNFKENVISERKNCAPDDTFPQISKCDNIPSEGLEADHISEESKPKDHEVTAGSNLMENVTNEIYKSATNDTFGQMFECENVPSEGLEAGHISEESRPKDHDVTAHSNLQKNVIRSNSNMHTLYKDPIVADIEDIQGRTGFNQVGKNATRKVSGPKAEQEKETNSSNTVVNGVSLTEFFSCDQIREHIMSLRKQFDQISTEEERGIAANRCQLCGMQKLFFSPVPIYCLCCGLRIKRNKYYYYKRAEEVVTEHCFCTACHNTSRGGSIMFNGISVSKELLDKKKNDEVFEEAWVQCDKCKSWQHQICALYNNKRDLDSSAEYICPTCRLKDIENGMHIPLPKTAIFGAKDLPSTMLSDHIEKRLFKCLMQEKEDWTKGKGDKNLDEVLAAENLSVRVVLSVDKQLKVKKQFLDIFLEENYPAEFPYKSQVILLFQKIEGVDVCLFGMYVQEFGSECGYPNQRCVYISYLDSVKYFRPERETVTGEALRTFVYHEILIGYLDFCKKRGFTTCYIWACPPLKGEDYLLYCHPDTQKTPKNDKLRRWYHSMLRKAAEENIVVGLTNIYDHLFVSAGKCDSKVTAARLPYFDGDFWSGTAMDLARKIEQENGGEYEKTLKEQVSKRSLKAMGYVNPSKDTAKDILVMMKLGQTILPFKEDFILVHLQYECMHCNEVMVSGKRWFCTECKNFQECERCHTADSHTSVSGEKHTLCQVLMDDISYDTKENEIILDNGLFESRHNFLSFCQKNQFQFDTLRRAKYSSMMILYHLRSPTLLAVETICSICCKHNAFQQSWKCGICPEFTVCPTCYQERGANCHPHKLNQTSSTALCQSGNQELREDSVLIRELLHVLRHASQCRSTKTRPCSYPNCLQIKKLFYHASKCTVRTAGGCQHCKKTWLALTVHSRNCVDSPCSVPRCMDLKKHAEWIAMQSESRRRAAVVESITAQ